MKVNRELSQELAKKVNAITGSCWLNAVNALDYLPDNTAYIEGWIVTGESFEVLEHGWLELDGEIIDPTSYTQNSIEYFPGIKLRNPPKQGHVLPFVYHYGLYSKQFESYQEAYNQAHNVVKEKQLERKTLPEEFQQDEKFDLISTRVLDGRVLLLEYRPTGVPPYSD